MHPASYLQDTGALSPVGGILTPPDKLAVFAPYLALLGIVVTVAVVAAMKPRRRFTHGSRGDQQGMKPAYAGRHLWLSAILILTLVLTTVDTVRAEGLLWAVTSNPGCGFNVANAVAVDGTGLYVVGFETHPYGVPGEPNARQWRVEKRELGSPTPPPGPSAAGVLLILAVLPAGIVGVAAAVILVRRSGYTSGSQRGTDWRPVTLCPRCHRPLTYFAPYEMWYCYSCRTYVWEIDPLRHGTHNNAAGITTLVRRILSYTSKGTREEYVCFNVWFMPRYRCAT